MKARAIVRLGVGLLLVTLAACAAGAGGGDKGENLNEDVGGPESLGGGYVWRRVGGIAGFCDVVTLTVDSPATVASCAAEPPETIGETELSAEQAGQLRGWVARLASFEHEQKDPATADALTITIDFTGRGDAQPTDADLAALEALAAQVLGQVASEQ